MDLIVAFTSLIQVVPTFPTKQMSSLIETSEFSQFEKYSWLGVANTLNLALAAYSLIRPE